MILAVGDVVRLVSGGPSMVIEAIVDERALCAWFDSTDALHEGSIPLALLRPAPARGRGTTIPQGVAR